MTGGTPIDMILFCPRCGYQHIDAPDEAMAWTNPPHRSHLCHECDFIWRPADVATNGVGRIKTGGGQDFQPYCGRDGRDPLMLSLIAMGRGVVAARKERPSADGRFGFVQLRAALVAVFDYKAPDPDIGSVMRGGHHSSDCAIHNSPALPRGECDCGMNEKASIPGALR